MGTMTPHLSLIESANELELRAMLLYMLRGRPLSESDTELLAYLDLLSLPIIELIPISRFFLALKDENWRGPLESEKEVRDQLLTWPPLAMVRSAACTA